MRSENVEVEAIPLRIRASSGATVEGGQAQVVRPSLVARARRSFGWLAGGVLGGLLFLPVPLVHFFGVVFFLVMSVVAVKTLGTTAVLRAAKGPCPACGREGSFFLGLGWRPAKFPATTSCKHCSIGLTLTAIEEI